MRDERGRFVKRIDSDPKNDYADGYRAGRRSVFSRVISRVRGKCPDCAGTGLSPLTAGLCAPCGGSGKI